MRQPLFYGGIVHLAGYDDAGLLQGANPIDDARFRQALHRPAAHQLGPAEFRTDVEAAEVKKRALHIDLDVSVVPVL